MLRIQENCAHPVKQHKAKSLSLAGLSPWKDQQVWCFRRRGCKHSNDGEGEQEEGEEKGGEKEEGEGDEGSQSQEPNKLRMHARKDPWPDTDISSAAPGYKRDITRSGALSCAARSVRNLPGTHALWQVTVVTAIANATHADDIKAPSQSPSQAWCKAACGR